MLIVIIIKIYPPPPPAKKGIALTPPPPPAKLLSSPPPSDLLSWNFPKGIFTNNWEGRAQGYLHAIQEEKIAKYPTSQTFMHL